VNPLLRAALALAVLAVPGPVMAADDISALRVCADPNNLPFSNEAGEGFENAIARLLAEDMAIPLEYEWWPQERGFLRKTLKAGKCDVVMGLPAHYEMAETTQPYYRSSYVFVYRTESGLDLSSLEDPRLRTLRIGVTLIGDDGVNTPPAHALGDLGIADNVTGYMVYGDSEDPERQAEIVKAVADGRLDTAVIWGPTAGYFAARSKTPLTVRPVADAAAFRPLEFEFSIAMGVRPGDDRLRDALNAALDRNAGRIAAILKDYGVPLGDDGDTSKEVRK
jgi:quinoprotein dehydrogenase-associated probable ABC transporter substrate-binding protein